jgi:hypothetical protein
LQLKKHNLVNIAILHDKKIVEYALPPYYNTIRLERTKRFWAGPNKNEKGESNGYTY